MWNGIIIAFAVTGIFLGVRELLGAAQHAQFATTLVSQSWVMAALWFGILSACFLIYRLARERVRSIPSASDRAPRQHTWTTLEDLWSVCTPETQTVLERAWHVAQHDGDRSVTVVHILQSLTDVPRIASMFARLGVDLVTLREKLHVIAPPEHGKYVARLDARAQAMLHDAFSYAIDHQWAHIEPFHLFAVLHDESDAALELLNALGVDQKLLREAVEWMLIQETLRQRIRRFTRRAASKPKGAIDRGYTAAATPILNQYSTDLTALARSGHLPFIVDRETELAEVFQMVETRKQGVLLVGESGVGKMSIVHLLAQHMAAEDVPAPLEDKRLVLVSSSALVAGAGAGQIEARVQAILIELQRAGNIVVAFEHFDQLVGASSGSGTSLDAAQMIAQAVGDGVFWAIATADTTAARQLLEQGSIPSAFQRLEITELDQPATRRVLQSRVGPIEYQQKVYFSIAAIDTVTELSFRYLHQQAMPGPALELLEEAGVAARKRGGVPLVSSDDVAGIVAARTKVQVTNVTAQEQDTLLHAEDILHRRVVGQSEAVAAVANALRRARTELRDPKRPIATFLFVGPTGVGKTELAKAVAEVQFGSDSDMLRLDMSEYQEVDSIDRLIGSTQSPSAGRLTGEIRAHPYRLILLDELEKAHPDILNIFLQVFDDGRLTDAAGRTIDFTNTIIIATSNAGTPHIQQRVKDGTPLATIRTELIEDVLQRTYRPEFLNRFDAIILFTPLSSSEIRTIVTMMIQSVSQQLEKRGIHFSATEAAIDELARIGFDPLFGARPLRRAIQDHVDNALATALLQGTVGRRDRAVLDVGGQLRIEKATQI
jgi:ATP-dependent Clp protease ATP-binding subunit ClpC